MTSDASKSIEFNLLFDFAVNKQSQEKAIQEMGGMTKKVMDDVGSKTLESNRSQIQDIGKNAKDFVDKIDRDFKNLFDPSKFKDVSSYIYGELANKTGTHSQKITFSQNLDKLFRDTERDMKRLQNVLGDAVESKIMTPEEAQKKYAQMFTTPERLAGAREENTAYREGLESSMQKVMQSSQNKKHISVIGAYVLGYMMSNIIQQYGQLASQEITAGAQIYQRTALGFDLSSIVGNRIIGTETAMGNQMTMAEIANRRRQVGYSTAGAIIGGVGGAVIGGLIGNPMMGAALGSGVGMSLSSMVAEIQGSQDIAKLTEQQTAQKERNKFMSQMMPLAYQFMGTYDTFDVARTRFGARTGGMGIGREGFGYDPATLYQMALQQEGITGKFNKETFQGQMAFSRAFGFDPNQIFQASVSTRYTGQQVGAEELMRRQQMAQMTGMGTRMPELIQALNNLSVMITRTQGSASERGMAELGMLPFAIYGDTAKGRLGDLGMETLTTLQGMFKQETGSPQDILLFNATKQLHKGNIENYQLLKEQGLTNPETLPSLLRGIAKYGQGNETFTRATLTQFTGSAVTSKEIWDKIINADKNKTPEQNIADFEKKLAELTEKTGDSNEALKQLIDLGDKNTSRAEKFQEKLAKEIISGIGKHVSELHNTLLTQTKEQLNALNGSWDKMMKEWYQGVKDFREAVYKFVNSVNEDEADLSKGQQPSQGELDLLWNSVQEKKDEKAYSYFMSFLKKAQKQGKVRKVTKDQRRLDLPDYFYFPINPVASDNELSPMDESFWEINLGEGIQLDDGSYFYIKDSKELKEMQEWLKKNRESRIQNRTPEEEQYFKSKMSKQVPENLKPKGIVGGFSEVNMNFSINVENLRTDKRKILQEVDNAIEELAERTEPTKLVGSSRN